MRQSWADAVEACTSKGVTERPPVAGVRYEAFTVYPPNPGKLYALTIAHRDGEMLVQDLIREDISVEDATDVLRRYGITKITGAVGDKEDALMHALAGVVDILSRQ
jgi:hypothetical protein